MMQHGLILVALVLGGLLQALTLASRPQPAERRSIADIARAMQAPVRTGVVDLVLGAVEGPEEYLFDRIRGIAVDSTGRVFVVDRSGYVRVYSDGGRYQYQFGGSGDGPGDLTSPCCINFDRRGRLWVQDRGLHIFDVGSTSARFVKRIDLVRGRQLPPGGHLDPLMPVVALEGGAVLASIIRSAGSRWEGGLLLLDSEGRVQSTRWLPFNDAFPELHARISGRRTLVTLPPPYAHRRLVALAPQGRIATAVNYEYSIEVTDLEGASSRVVRRDVVGPAITQRERDSVLVQYRGLAPLYDLEDDIVIPSRKPVLRALWYDLDGRLWVQRSSADGAGPTQADVYGQNGSLLFRAIWPADVTFNRAGSSGSAVAGDTAYGIRTTTMGVQQVVRVRFQERRP